MKKKNKKTRVAPLHKNGITKYDAPFWCGDNAELVMSRRLIERAEKAASRRRGGRRSVDRAPETPSRELRRLERALPRRKTLAARQRIELRIKQLKEQSSSPPQVNDRRADPDQIEMNWGKVKVQ